MERKKNALEAVPKSCENESNSNSYLEYDLCNKSMQKEWKMKIKHGGWTCETVQRNKSRVNLNTYMYVHFSDRKVSGETRSSCSIATGSVVSPGWPSGPGWTSRGESPWGSLATGLCGCSGTCVVQSDTRRRSKPPFNAWSNTCSVYN